MDQNTKTSEQDLLTERVDDIDFADEFDDMVSGQEKIENIQQFLTFQSGDSIFGIDVNRVREVIEYDRVFNIPLTPEYIAGVINLRGEVVPIIDLHSRFYSAPGKITKFSCMVIVDAGSDDETILIGILIDAIKAVAGISTDDIEPAPGFGAKIRSDFIWSIGKTDTGFIVLLNIDMVLNIDELCDYEAI